MGGTHHHHPRPEPKSTEADGNNQNAEIPYFDNKWRAEKARISKWEAEKETLEWHYGWRTADRCDKGWRKYEES